MVGINNRDLRDMSIDLNRTRQLAARLGPDVTVISESGIHTYAEVRELSHFANGFLIGSALMEQADLEAAVKRVLLGENKVCGLTRPQDAQVAWESGAIYGGLIFVPTSPRAVNDAQAKAVIAAAPLQYVGVFRNAPLDEVVARAQALELAAVQLHGDEDQAYIDALRDALADSVRIWKALSVGETLPSRTLRHVDKYLLDNGQGGSGQRFVWSLLQGQDLRNVMLAGGLGADNCVEAAARGCAGLDFNSGVESQPGIKDASKLASVPDAARILRSNNEHFTEPYFGEFGGMYVPQILMPALRQLEEAFVSAQKDPAFQAEFTDLLKNYAGRPTALTKCRNLTEGTRTTLYLKREDLLHGGAHKTNQVLGQALLAKRMGKTEIIAETGAGQHGVALALASALLGLKCRIYMGAKDVERQSPNVFRMRLMGAEVIPVHSGSATLKDACNEALRDWSGSYEKAHYMLGTAAGPHPFPTIVREFQRMIGEETKAQILEKEGRMPDAVIACVGGGSNAIGMFADFIEETNVGLIGVEPAGHGIESGEHGAPLKHGRVGIAGDEVADDANRRRPDRRILPISAGLDFPSVGPQHAFLNNTVALTMCRSPMTKRWRRLKRSPRHEGSSRRWSPLTLWPMR